MSYFNSRNLSALSNEAIMRKAPAVFAQSPKSTTSDNYLFISTERLLGSRETGKGLRSQGWEVVAAKQTMNRATKLESRETNKHVLFLARTENLQRGANFGDSLPLLKVTNSHNGASAFGLSSGFFRVVCANGLTVPDSIYAAPKVRHTQDMINEVINATCTVLKDFPRLIEMRNALSSITLSQDEKFLLADAAADIFFDKSERDLSNMMARTQRNDRYLIESQLIQSQRYEDKKSDLWTISNVIQENMIRGNVRTVSTSENPYNGGTEYNLRSQRKVTSIDRDNDIHEKLFKLTQKFAELKGVKIGAIA